MRDRRTDRFVVLPFSVGCVSQSSVAVCENQPKRAQAGTAPPASSSGRPKNSFSILLFPRPNVAAGFQKLAKSFKSLSHYFVFEEDEEDEEEEAEMEIGFPTDVQHVAHIGLDGLSHTPVSGKPSEFLPLNSFLFDEAVRAGHGGAGW
ncbi:hypothetical protein ZIOFF_019760 [Zingiber officinale]|uniref:CRIB domain-containing protein n=1 Tax=Zingiber officinale TaxID=94328 RepID=A0A8J5LTB7_ZINOF|nr:hypothetical protein ZIOFF_019760 [Zingiber officinale]